MAERETVVIPCPVPGYNQLDDGDNPVYWIEAYDEWLAGDQTVVDEAVEKWSKVGVPNDKILTFVVSLALLVDWRLPGLESHNTEKWELEKLPLAVMSWVNQSVYGDFKRCEAVPKGYLPLSMRQRAETVKAAGTSGQTS